MSELDNFIKYHKRIFNRDYISPIDFYQIAFDKMKHNVHDFYIFTILFNQGVIKYDLLLKEYSVVDSHECKWKQIPKEEVYRRLIITLRKDKIERLKEKIK